MTMLYKCTFLIASIYLIISLLSRMDNITLKDTTSHQLPPFVSNYFEKWNDCAKIQFLNSNVDAKEFWKSFQTKSRKCDSDADIQNSMNVLTFKNRDEKKFGILPIQNSSESIFITLGIGQDTIAEELFLEKMNEQSSNVTFYGADPIPEGNSELYSEIGQYLPFAVGGKTGFSTASVLKNGKYQKLVVVHIDINYFISEILQEKTIDYLWMDSEYAEYGTFDIFYKNGRMSQEAITFCQMSIEIHNPNMEQKEQFMALIKRLLEEKQFGFFFSHNVGHIRLWLFNFGSHYCVNKFLKTN